MKRLLLASIAIVMLAAPIAQAQAESFSDVWQRQDRPQNDELLPRKGHGGHQNGNNSNQGRPDDRRGDNGNGQRPDNRQGNNGNDRGGNNWNGQRPDDRHGNNGNDRGGNNWDGGRPNDRYGNNWNNRGDRGDYGRPYARWQKGQHMPRDQWGRDVDYRRHHLQAPPRGYRWVQQDNQFFLIGLTSGLIGAIIGANSGY